MTRLFHVTWVLIFGVIAVPALADVFNMPTGKTSLETVPVSDAGNIADMRYNLDRRPEGYGRVDYDYRIGKFEVTAAQYTEFLNAVAKTDTHGLYNANMADPAARVWGCSIQRSGVSGSYSYSVASDYANRPVNFVSWGDAARFCNWLHNGQPTGAQNASTTENGSYHLNGAMSNEALLAITRNANATWVIPLEDEWYKAAYYKGGSTNAGYWEFPTGTNSMPGQDMTEITNTGNNANFNITSSDPFNVIDSGIYYMTEVGEFERSDGPYGTFDQGGNVWELNDGVTGLNRGYRGGNFYDYYWYMTAAAGRYTTASSEGITGFRVVEVPEPLSFVLLMFGGMALIRRKRQ